MIKSSFETLTGFTSSGSNYSLAAIFDSAIEDYRNRDFDKALEKIEEYIKQTELLENVSFSDICTRLSPAYAYQSLIYGEQKDESSILLLKDKFVKACNNIPGIKIACMNNAILNLGNAIFQFERYNSMLDAYDYIKKAEEFMENIEPCNEILAMIQQTRGHFAWYYSRKNEAVDYSQNAVLNYKKLFLSEGKIYPSIVATYEDLFRSYCLVDKEVEAEELTDELVSVMEKYNYTIPNSIIMEYASVGSYYSYDKDYKNSIKAYEKFMEYCFQALEKEKPIDYSIPQPLFKDDENDLTAAASVQLAKLLNTYFLAHDFEGCVKYFDLVDKSLSFMRKDDYYLLGQTVDLYQEQATLYIARKEYDKAVSLIEKTLKLIEGKEDELCDYIKHVGKLYRSLGNAKYFQKKYDEAIKYHNLSLETYLSKLYMEESSVAELLNRDLGDDYRMKGDKVNAKKHYQKADEIFVSRDEDKECYVEGEEYLYSTGENAIKLKRS